MALFSVVIPTYNRAIELERCLMTVLRQPTEEDLEVIVVDDGSTDETEQVARRLVGERGHYIYQENAGPCVARNLGAAHANAKMLVFLDSDDELNPGWFEEMEGLVMGHGGNFADLASAGVTVHEVHTGRVTDFAPPELGPAFGDYTASYVPGTYAVSSELFRTAGGFAEDIPYGEHHELGLRIGSIGDGRLVVRSSATPVVVKHHDRSPEVSQQYLRAKLVATQRTLVRHRPAFERDPDLEANLEYVAGYCAAHLGQFRLARLHFFLSLKAIRRAKPAISYVAALVPGLRQYAFRLARSRTASGQRKPQDSASVVR